MRAKRHALSVAVLYEKHNPTHPHPSCNVDARPSRSAALERIWQSVQGAGSGKQNESYVMIVRYSGGVSRN